jgi:hypothetical protein
LASVKESRHRHYAKKTGQDPEECRKRRVDPEAAREHKRRCGREDYQKNRTQYLYRAKQRADRLRDKIAVYHASWRAKNAQRKSELDKLWRKKNVAKLNSYYSARRDRRALAEPSWLSAIEKAQIVEQYDLARCLTVQTGIKHHVDHIWPLGGDSFCGLHVPWNLRVVTCKENLSKGRKPPADATELLWRADRCRTLP